MELKHRTKILLGIATIWPPIYILLFVVGMFGMILLSAGAPGDAAPPIFAVGFIVIFILHVVTILGALGLTIFYIVHVVKNEALEGNMKIVWILLFFFAGMFAEPVYWYLQIWKAQPSDVQAQLQPPPAASWAQTDETREAQRFDPSRPPDWR